MSYLHNQDVATFLTHTAGMSSWVYVVIGYFVYQIIVKGIESDRAQRIAKTEAKLKIELVERLRDPDIVQQVLETRMSGADASPDDGQALQVQLELGKQALAREKVKEHATRSSGSGGWLILPGLVCFLTGAAFITAHLLGGSRVSSGLLLPGLVCVAVGWALLAFVVYQKDQAKKKNAQSQEADSLLPSETAPQANELSRES